MAFIKIDDLIKIYNPSNKNSVSALRGVKLEIEKASFVTLIGPSGCGKSTLINLLALFDKPTGGSITIEGIQDIFKLDEDERVTYHQSTLGFISQFSTHNLIPNWTVENNIKIPMMLKNNLSKTQIDERIDELLVLIGLSEMKKRKVSTLSGGENQRIALASALANKPELLLADEPTGELDSKNTIIFTKILKEIVKKYGTTVLVVTHNNILADNSEIAWIMEDGKISGLYKQVNNGTAINLTRKYSTFVDDQGNLRLPKEIIQKAKIKNSVSIEFNEESKIVELSPDD